MYACKPERDHKTGITLLESESMVFHCNHYNRFLQLVVEDCHYIQHEPILQNSAAEVVYRQLCHAIQKHPEWSIEERLGCAETIYRYCGFGDLHLLPAATILRESPVVVSEQHSHYGSALRLNYGHRRNPGEFFDLGFAIGAVAASVDHGITGRIASRSGEEVISLGGNQTSFPLFPADIKEEFPLGTPSLAPIDLPADAYEIEERTFALHVDEDQIIEAVTSLPLAGNEHGLIPAFGVYLTRHYADYYNLVSFRFEEALAQALSTHKYLGEMLWYEYPSLFFYKEKFSHLQGKVLAKTLLIEAGHICGFNTMGGIMRSDAWYQLVVPQLKQREDWLAGIIACINALGWGIWRIVEIEPNERLVVRAWHPYESLGHLRAFGRADHPVDYLMTGICASLMNLLYSADITEKPDLTLDFYYRVNRSKDGFWGHQTRCVAMGDPYSEVVVERNII
ncbi:hypothetical protein [Candidatus Igneacidithiobacillus taiwanensis]|uniref:hypothetical protein n=1 Tax=Candidatus Igneacidithiobacillus taiwanensis TaxID=1945924 RepID=UPI00289DE962|nr:hypothetical protein [Candidatus Igneacidithiobacillus taiwanensis]MCE5360950.1 hypothetical protein [Acidithiobacillus sp.]